MKKLSIEQIKNGELIGKPEFVAIKVKLNGEDREFETYILPFSYQTAVAQMQAYGEKKEALAGILASVICDKKGNLIFTEDDIREKFNQALVDAIWSEVVSINMLGKKSNSQTMTNSSSKLGSASEKVTQKSKDSHTKKSKDIQHTQESTEASTLVGESNKS